MGDDELWGVTREHKGADHTLAALKSIRAARPGGYRLFVILDNLAANKTPAIRRWARRENVELCLTPTNASWANPIEAHFGPLRTFVMSCRPSRPHRPGPQAPGIPALANAHARHPDVLAPSAANEPRPQRTPAALGPPNPKPHNGPGKRSWSAH